MLALNGHFVTVYRGRASVEWRFAPFKLGNTNNAENEVFLQDLQDELDERGT